MDYNDILDDNPIEDELEPILEEIFIEYRIFTYRMLLDESVIHGLFDFNQNYYWDLFKNRFKDFYKFYNVDLDHLKNNPLSFEENLKFILKSDDYFVSDIQVECFKYFHGILDYPQLNFSDICSKLNLSPFTVLFYIIDMNEHIRVRLNFISEFSIDDKFSVFNIISQNPFNFIYKVPFDSTQFPKFNITKYIKECFVELPNFNFKLPYVLRYAYYNNFISTEHISYIYGLFGKPIVYEYEITKICDIDYKPHRPNYYTHNLIEDWDEHLIIMMYDDKLSDIEDDAEFSLMTESKVMKNIFSLFCKKYHPNLQLNNYISYNKKADGIINLPLEEIAIKSTNLKYFTGFFDFLINKRNFEKKFCFGSTGFKNLYDIFEERYDTNEAIISFLQSYFNNDVDIFRGNITSTISDYSEDNMESDDFYEVDFDDYDDWDSDDCEDESSIKETDDSSKTEDFLDDFWDSCEEFEECD